MADLRELSREAHAMVTALDRTHIPDSCPICLLHTKTHELREAVREWVDATAANEQGNNPAGIDDAAWWRYVDACKRLRALAAEQGEP